MLIYAGILSLFMLGLLSSFVLARRQYFMAQAQSDAIHATQLTTGMIGLYLSTGARSTLIAQDNPPANPPAVIFLSAKTDNGIPFEVDAASGKIMWQRWVCFYLDIDSNTLKLSEQEITPTTTPPAPPTFATMIGLPSRMVARDVEDLGFLPSAASPTSYQLVTRARPSVSNPQPTGLSFGGQLTMRNSGN